MFNISFGEIVAVAVVGLIVIGPRRLPETARFLGHLTSRVQRQVAEVKSDIRREMDLEDLKQIQREYEGAAREIKDDISANARELRDAADIAKWPGGDSAAANENIAGDGADSETGGDAKQAPRGADKSADEKSAADK